MEKSEKLSFKRNKSIDGLKMTCRVKKVPNTIMTSKTVLPYESYKNYDKSIEKLKWVDYEDMQSFIIKHKKELFTPGKKYKIIVLGPTGWRSAKERLFTSDEIDFYNPELWYDDEDELDECAAVQIIEIP